MSKALPSCLCGSKPGFAVAMSAVAAYNDMMKNYGSIGSADAASIMHNGNSDKFNTANFIAGSEGQSLQKMGKTTGLGVIINDEIVSMSEIENVSMVQACFRRVLLKIW